MMKNKFSNVSFRKIMNKAVEFVLLNRLFLSFVIISLLGFIVARYGTLGMSTSWRIFTIDLALISIFGLFSYLIKPKNRFKYLFFWLALFCFMQIMNTIYYKFYTSFCSLGEFATLGQVESVGDSLFDKLDFFDFIYLIGPLTFYYIHLNLAKSSYYYNMNKLGFRKNIFQSIFSLSILLLLINLVNSTSTELSRLSNQWNRNSIVESFGLVAYHINDFVQTTTPKFFSLFGYEDAVLAFNEYFDNNGEVHTNKYTGVLEGKNIILVHMESIQTFLMDLEYNGEEVLPNTNKLASEGMFFPNFYPQISTGTSSDAEFTILSSMYPALSGIVFVSYYDRYYNTLPKILGEVGYNSFSMHGNNFTMWNRHHAHPSLGYKEFYFEDSYTYTDDQVLGLGINDYDFFMQSFDYLVDIDNNNDNYMGTIITLSNHSPFKGTDKFLEYDLSVEVLDESGNLEVIDPLSNLSIGRYLKNAHYADYALGEFMEMVEESDNFDDTVFIFYGDHDAKFSQDQIYELFTYNQENGEFDVEVTYDTFDHEINKRTPLIFWSKNENVRKHLYGEYDYVFGSIDLGPTILNMMGLYNKYAFGTDIFEVKDENVVIFPNSSFLTKDLYYNNSKEEYKILNQNVVLDDDYISDFLEEAAIRLNVSNSIIVYDLIKKEVLNKSDEEEEKVKEEN